MKLKTLSFFFNEFNFYSLKLLTPIGSDRSYLGVAAATVCAGVVGAARGENYLGYVLPLAAGLLTSRLGSNAYNWAFEARRFRPLWDRTHRGWEQFDRHIQLGGEVVTLAVVAVAWVASVRAGISPVSGLLIPAARQIAVCGCIIDEMGGTGAVVSYRSIP